MTIAATSGHEKLVSFANMVFATGGREFVKQSFKIGPLPHLLYGVFALGYIATVTGPAINLGTQFAARSVGVLVGTLAAAYLLPLAVAWSVWLISGKRRFAGSLAFGLVLALTALANVVGPAVEDRRKRATISELQSQYAAYLEQVEAGEDEDGQIAATRRFQANLGANFERLAELGAGDEQDVWEQLRECTDQAITMKIEWLEALRDVRSLRRSIQGDCAALKGSGGIEGQRKYVDRLLGTTTRVRHWCNQLPMMLAVRLQHVDDSSQAKRGVIEGAIEWQLESGDATVASLDALIELAVAFDDTLAALQRHRGDWTHAEGGLDIKSDELRNILSAKLALIRSLELRIETLDGA